MDPFQIIAVLLTVTAAASYLNHRFIKLPPSIGLTLIALAASLLLVGVSHLGWPLADHVRPVLRQVDFSRTLLGGILSFLLFAGSLHVNLSDLHEERWNVTALATLGVVCSTGLVGTLTVLVTRALGAPLGWGDSLIFGALISPTDPVAVLALLKQARAPRLLGTRIAGESLFNDGVGVVLFVVLVDAFYGGDTGGPAGPGPAEIGLLLAREAGGGLLLGLLLGGLTFLLLRPVDDYRVELLLTLALVTGGYALATALHTSGLLAMVAAGLMIGNFGREAMSLETRGSLDKFWELVDETLNALLFVLIGLEVLVLPWQRRFWWAGLLSIPVALAARFLSVWLTVTLLRARVRLGPHTVTLLTWGGLRGGLSVAMALSLPAGSSRDLLLAMTYAVVVFSIAVQGTTMNWLLRRTGRAVFEPAA